jgi:hypothetical protein
MSSGCAGKGIVFLRAFASFTHFLSFFIFISRKQTDVERRVKQRFQFEKSGAYTQTLKSEDNSAVRHQNRGSGTIASNLLAKYDMRCASLDTFICLMK